MKLIAALLIAAALSACSGKAEESRSAGVDFKVDKLFTVDGCTVYRFTDSGAYRYFTNCSGSASWREACGKHCTRDVSVNGGA
ncbi:conserved exported hypothetical protein [Cupriavidus necator]|uniref:DUF4884 domain-containing protein n=1 Tax=Cupriavidus necator TaxID=106590 RepID=A0A1K0JC78_CUPNE|nr:conserved exported hypothetical protein [Cupriavidus necator]